MQLHETYKRIICGEKGQTFLTDFILKEKPWSSSLSKIERKITYIPIQEFAFAQPTERKDVLGRPVADVCFIDLVLFVGSGKSAAYHGNVVTIGVEVKSNLGDLLRDNKMNGYLHKTDYTFLAVPDGLVRDALNKVAGIEGIGVFSLSSGRIIKAAKRQTVEESTNNQALLRALFGARNTPISFQIDKKEIQRSFQVVPPCEDKLKESLGVINEICLTQKLKVMNFVGNRTPEVRVVRFELKNGKFTLWKGSNQPVEEYDYCEGKLLGIDIRRRETKNGEMVYCDFHMQNGDDLFDISTLASSCVTADLVSRLKNVEDPANSMLRIDAWKNLKYTNVIMKENGRPVPHSQIPRVQKIDRGFKVESDSSARDQAVMNIINDINARIQQIVEIQ